MTSPFSPNESFNRIFLLKGIDERRTKTGKPYLTVILGTPEGNWDGRVWDMAMDSLPGLLEGDPVRARGSVQLYQDKTQLILEDISKVDEPVDPRDIYPAASASESQLRKDFSGFTADINEPALKKLMDSMILDQDISDTFFICPAAITMHHARIGGLAEHSLNVCRLALASVSAAPWLDRDLLTVGALLHDIGKIKEYEVAGDFRYTLEGKFLGHIVQGHLLTEKWIRQIPDFPERLALDVLHIILSHHGQLEFGSPKAPVTGEALVIHFADDLDAKLDMINSAGKEPGTEEAFVRGLGRSFQYRNERQETGNRGNHAFGVTGLETEKEDQETKTRDRSDAEKVDVKTRTHGIMDTRTNEPTELPNNGDKDSRPREETGKKKSGGQEELF